MCPGQLHLNSFANLSLSLFSSILVCLQHRGKHVCLKKVSMSINNKTKNKNKNKKKKKKKIKNKNKKTKKSNMWLLFCSVQAFVVTFAIFVILQICFKL